MCIYICTHKSIYIIPGLAFQHFLRDSPPYSVFTGLCVYPLIQSSISRQAVKASIQSPTGYTLLYKWENLKWMEAFITGASDIGQL